MMGLPGSACAAGTVKATHGSGFCNVAFFITRIMLFLGYFHYGARGILDLTHTRLMGELVAWRLGNFVHDAVSRANT